MSEGINMDSSMAEDIGSPKKYAVIGFVDDNSVEIIPCNWIISAVEALWPPPTTSTSTLQRLIKDCSEAKFSWKSFQIKIYSKTNSYLKATRKLNMARELSSISCESSESEDKLVQPQIHFSQTEKRKRKIPARYTDYSLDDCLDSNDSIDLPSAKSQMSSSESSSDEEVVLKRVGKKYRISRLHSKSDSSRANKTKGKNPNEMLEMKSLMLKVLNLQEKSYRKLKSLEKQCNELKEELISLKDLSRKKSDPSTICTLPTLPENLSLPVESDEQLLSLENEIGRNMNLRNKLVRFLFQATLGKNEGAFLIAVMKTLVTRDVAMMYSRLGRKGKKSFVAHTNLYNVVLTAASLKFPNSTREFIAERLGKVLSNSTDWHGGRKKTEEDHNDTLCIEL